MKIKNIFFSVLLISTFFGGCATLDSSQDPSSAKTAKSKDPKAGSGAKSQSNLAKGSNSRAGNNATSNVNSSGNAVEINARVAMEFYLKHLTTHQSLDIDDKMTVGLLEEKRGSKIQLYEAAYYLGWLKLNKEKLSFKSSEDYAEQATAFLQAVAANALLQHPRVAVYFQLVFDRAKSQGLTFDLTAVKGALKPWLDDTSNAASALADVFDGSGEQAEVGSESQKEIAHDGTPTGDEALIVKADELAGNGEGKQALNTLAKIRSTSPVYSEATSRTQKISTTQVMNLRKKAAEEFQKALPVPDGESKKAMLMNAKRYLEEALKDYPQAAPDQIVKTKTNLDIIIQKIEQTDVAMRGK